MLQVAYMHDFVILLLNAVERDSSSFSRVYTFNISDCLSFVSYIVLLKRLA